MGTTPPAASSTWDANPPSQGMASTRSPTRHRVDAVAHGHHVARHLAARREGQRRLDLVLALDEEAVDEVHAGGPHGDDDLARARARGRGAPRSPAGRSARTRGRRQLSRDGAWHETGADGRARLGACASRSRPLRSTRPGPTCSAVWQAADEIELFESAWTFDHFYPIFSDSTGPVPRGLDRHDGAGPGDEADPRRRARDRQPLPAPGRAGEHGRDARRHLRRSPRAGPRRGLEPGGERRLRHRPPAAQGAVRSLRRGARGHHEPAHQHRVDLRRGALPAARRAL